MSRYTRTFWMLSLALCLPWPAVRADEPGVEEETHEVDYELALEAFQAEDFQDDLARIEGAQIKLQETIRFHFALTKLNRSSWPILNRVVDLLKAHPEVTHIKIEGHTDFIGERDNNQKLSEERAAKIKDYLIAHGIHPNRLAAEGFGEDRPRVSGKSPSRRRINRRVEFILTTQGARIEDRYPGLAEVIYTRGKNVLWESPDQASPVTLRQAIEQGAALECGPESWFMLRFQDLGRLSIEAESRIKLVRLEWDPDSELRSMAVKVIRGAVELNDVPGSEAVILTAEGAVTLVGAHARAERREGTTIVSIYRGQGRLETSNSVLDLEAGQVYRFSSQGEGSQLVSSVQLPPTALTPTETPLLPGAELSWKSSSSQKPQRYVVEYAGDPQFVSLLIRQETAEPQTHLPRELDAASIYVRVRSVDDAGLLGASSPVYEITLAADELTK